MDGDFAGFLFGMALLLLFIAAFIFAIYQLVVIMTRRRNVSQVSNESYRHLAEQATEAQQRTADELTDLRQRIEKVLREVE